MSNSTPKFEQCPYCKQQVFSVALHVAVCPACVETEEPETKELVEQLEQHLASMLQPERKRK